MMMMLLRCQLMVKCNNPIRTLWMRLSSRASEAGTAPFGLLAARSAPVSSYRYEFVLVMCIIVDVSLWMYHCGCIMVYH